MSRRSQQTRPQTRQQSAAPVKSAAKKPVRNHRCRVLVLSDGTKLRQEEIAKLLQDKKELSKSEQDIKVLGQQAEQSFHSWLEVEFSNQLKDMRSDASQLEELRDFMEMVGDYAEAKGMALFKAFSKLDGVRRAGELESFWKAFVADEEEKRRIRREKRIQKEQESGSRDRHRNGHEGQMSPEEAFFREVARSMGMDFDDIDEAFSSSGFSEQAADDADWEEKKTIDEIAENFDNYIQAGDSSYEAVKTRLKTTYRTLVKALHPDHNGDAIDKAAWYAVQEAYRKGDLEELLRLSSQIIGGEGAMSLDSCPIGDIISLRKSVASKLRIIRQELSKLRNSVPGRFWKAKEKKNKLADFKKRLGRQLREEHAEIMEELEGRESMISTWKKQAENHQAREARKKEKRAQRR